MQVTWKVEGKVKLKHNDSTISTLFGSEVALEDSQAKVSAREKILGVWGPFNSCDTVRTKSDGFIRSKERQRQK